MSSGNSDLMMHRSLSRCHNMDEQDEDNRITLVDKCEDVTSDPSTIACSSPLMSGISLEIPTDIALLHIETDLLLEKLRESGISPKIPVDQEDYSPISMKTVSTDTHTTAISAEFDVGDDDYQSSMSVCSDDDGMRCELQKLDKATSSLQRCLQEEEYTSEFFNNWFGGKECTQPDDTFSRFLDELFMAFHDATCYLLRSKGAKDLFRIKLVRNVTEVITSRPLDTMVRTYCFIFIVNFFVKIHQMIG